MYKIWDYSILIKIEIVEIFYQINVRIIFQHKNNSYTCINNISIINIVYTIVIITVMKIRGNK